MTRVLSAALLLPIVFGIVWFLPSGVTLAVAVFASLLACREYAAISAALGAPLPRTAVSAAVMIACAGVATDGDRVDIVVFAGLLIVGVAIVTTQRPGASALMVGASAVFAIVYIGLPLGAIAAIHHLGGREALMLLMVTIIVSDSAQYYTGRAVGRQPLAPAISPKKTREGAIGGIVLGTAVMVLLGRVLLPLAPLVLLAITAVLVVALGMIGDLFESLLKRSAGIKDSSALIPGHGGILDRIDSWLFAGPAFYMFIRYLQR
jgi:phosphatidate cytidylyltransferase